MSDSGRWDRIQDLFEAALTLEPGAREAFLARLADPAVADEVRSLLRAHDDASGFLGQPPALPPADPDLQPGDRLGHWRITGLVGRGGMGVVYRATRDDASFTKDVAIKVIDPGMRSDLILRRFRSERQILALLEHPNIARLIDGGTAPDGSPYLVMEYVAGRTLLDWCDERALTIDQRIDLFLQVCDAVSFAHQHLVVHRDLKSDNILVGEDGAPRLLDFGIAKLIAPDTGGPAATLTAPMQRMLTPEYASPEQVRGEPAAVASDVYSLGVILYELLSGTRPLKFPTRTPEEILRVVLEVDPPPPSTVVARSPEGAAAKQRGETTERLRRRLSRDLDHVVLKALEKEPARRYGSVEQLAQDLRRHRDGLPVLARGASTTYRVSRFVRRHRTAVVGSALVLAALVAGLASTAWQARVANRERDLARRRFDDVRELAHAVLYDIHDAIVGLPGSTKARELLVKHGLHYLDGLAKEAGDDVRLRHEIGVAYGKIADVQGRPMFANLGQTAEARKSYEKALALLEPLAEANPDSMAIANDVIVVSQNYTDLLGAMGHREEAMRRAVATRKRIDALLARHPGDPVFLNNLAVQVDRLVDMKLAAGDTLGSLAENRTHVALNLAGYAKTPHDAASRRGLMIALAKFANLEGMIGRRDTALVAYERSEALATEAYHALPDNTEAVLDLSIVYGMHGTFLAEQDLDAGLAVYRRGMVLAESLATIDPGNVIQLSQVAIGHLEVGGMLSRGGRAREAERSYAEAYRRFEALAAADTSNAEHRVFMARCSRGAGECCARLADSGPAGERAVCRRRAIDWLGRSRELYAKLNASGALPGSDADAPAQVDRALAALAAGR